MSTDLPHAGRSASPLPPPPPEDGTRRRRSDAAPATRPAAVGDDCVALAGNDSAALASDAATAAAVDRCATITADAGSSFYHAFLPLPRARREGIFSVYAFCRRIDDIVDEPEPGADPRAQISAWRRRVEAIASAKTPPPDPALTPADDAITAALEATHRLFGLRAGDLHAVIDGVAMDLDGTRYESADDLAIYCERVAGRVGCLCLPIFGADVEACRPHALALGHAFQLTNILRDVPRDAREGRIYVPAAHRRRFGVGDEDLAAVEPSAQALALLRFESERALDLFDAAAALEPRGQQRALFSARMMTAIYRRLLERLRDDPEAGWRERVSLPRHQKVLLAAGTWLRDRVLRLS